MYATVTRFGQEALEILSLEARVNRNRGLARRKSWHIRNSLRPCAPDFARNLAIGNTSRGAVLLGADQPTAFPRSDYVLLQVVAVQMLVPIAVDVATEEVAR